MQPKEVILSQIGELSQILAITGTFEEDGQSLFISQSILTVLKASQNEAHAMCFFRHLTNFIGEVQVMEGEKDVNSHLVEMDRFGN
jgi:hypothetical protein